MFIWILPISGHLLLSSSLTVVGRIRLSFSSQEVYSLIPETCEYYVTLQREIKAADEIKIANQRGSAKVEEGGRREGQSDTV